MAHISPDDVVPALRANLAFSRSPHGLGTGLLSVKNVDSGEEFMFRGFEYSLARMMDGRRTAAEVVDAAGQVGLPVTLDDLEGFVNKLKDRHLVQQPTEAAEDAYLSPFEARRDWDEKTRQLFRIALREGRAGNLNRALVSLDCLLHEQPHTLEAIHLREKLEERKMSIDRVAPFRTVFAETEKDWRKVAVPAASKLPPGRALVIAGFVCLGLGVLTLAAGLVPFPQTITAPATLMPLASSTVIAPRAGTVATVAVAAGQWVDQGATLFTYDISDAMRSLETAVGRLEALNQALYTALPTTPEARAARQRFSLAESRLVAAEAEMTISRQTIGDPLVESEEAQNVALLEHSQARDALDGYVPREQLAELRAQRAEVQALELQLLDSEFKAPQAGVVSALAVRPGAQVVKGLEVVKIDDTRTLKAVAVVDARDRRAMGDGLPVILISNERATSGVVDSFSGRTVEVIVDNQAMTFQPGAAEVQVRGRPVPLIR